MIFHWGTKWTPRSDPALDTCCGESTDSRLFLIGIALGCAHLLISFPKPWDLFSVPTLSPIGWQAQTLTAALVTPNFTTWLHLNMLFQQWWRQISKSSRQGCKKKQFKHNATTISKKFASSVDSEMYPQSKGATQTSNIENREIPYTLKGRGHNIQTRRSQDTVSIRWTHFGGNQMTKKRTNQSLNWEQDKW